MSAAYSWLPPTGPAQDYRFTYYLASMFRSLLLLALVSAGCTASKTPAAYFISTDSPLVCCRTLRYSTAEFPMLRPSTLAGQGVVVRLNDDTVRGSCMIDAYTTVTVANNGSEDIYLPISHELSGDTMKLYPWRLVYQEKRQVRLARQIQYGDLVERTDARLSFYRLPAGKQVDLVGVIPQRWLCTPPSSLVEGYLEGELDPQYLAEASRSIRGSVPSVDADIFGPMGLRYDVAYTTLGFLQGLPVRSEQWNSRHDTATIHVAVKEEPAKILNASQQVSSSNVVTVIIQK